MLPRFCRRRDLYVQCMRKHSRGERVSRQNSVHTKAMTQISENTDQRGFISMSLRKIYPCVHFFSMFEMISDRKRKNESPNTTKMLQYLTYALKLEKAQDLERG